MKLLFGLFFVTGLLLTGGCAPGVVSTANPVDAVTTPVAQLTEASAVAPSSEPGNETGGPKTDKTATLPQLPNTPQNANLASTPPGVDEFVNLAKQDLANRLNIGVNQISLLKTTEITWPDISKGCSPAAGQVLSKGQVSGYRIWLEAERETYIYHVGLNSQVIVCPSLNPGANNPLLMTPGGPPPIPGDQSP